MVLQRLDGVQAAAIGRRRKQARVLYDRRRTSEQEIAAGLRRAGYQAETALRPATRRPSVRIGISAVAFANLVVIARLSGQSGQSEDPSVGLVQGLLSALVLVVSGLPLLRQALARRLEKPVLLACAGALASFGLGLFELATAPLSLPSIPGLFGEARSATPLFGFESAAGIVLLTCLSQHAAAAFQRGARALLAPSRERPGDARELSGDARELTGRNALLSDMDAEVRRSLARIDAGAAPAPPWAWAAVAQRTVLVSALSFAVFALVLHSWVDGIPLSPSAVVAAIAVLVSASAAASSVAAPAARAIAVLQARAVGVVIKDSRALDILADVSVACFDLPSAAASAGPAASGIPFRIPGLHAAVRAVWRRGLGGRLLSSDAPELMTQLAHWLGIPCSAGLSAAAKARAITELQLGGARVLLISPGAPRIAGVSAADVTVAIAPGTPPRAVGAPIVTSGADLDALPALLDLARALRRRLGENAALSVIYNGLVIPAAALGWISPLQAASLALIETMFVLTNAARLFTVSASAVAETRMPAPDVEWEPDASAQSLPDPNPAPRALDAVGVSWTP